MGRSCIAAVVGLVQLPPIKTARAFTLSFLEINLTSPDFRWAKRNAAFKRFLGS